MPVWQTIEGCDDRGSMQKIREQYGMVVGQPKADSLLKDVVIKDVTLGDRGLE